MVTKRKIATAGTPSISAGEFATLLSDMPFAPQQTTAKGLIAPMLRSMGHVLFIVGALASDPPVLKEEELQRELDDAAGHLDPSTLIGATTLSDASKTLILAYCTAVGHAKDSAAFWTPEEKSRLLRDLANRAAGLGAFLDREFVGINDSDPGSSL